MVFSPVHPFRHCGRLVHESLSVKCPHEILCGRATERSTRIEVTDEYPLLQFRTFKLDSEVAVDARDYIIEHYSVDLSGYDIVVGYRADDSYFQYAESFVSNTLPLRSLNKALRLGKLGEQTVVISQRGFERLKFVDAYSVDKNVYYPKFLDRDTKARDTYRKEIKKTKSYRDDIFVLDILREEMSNDDPRIQRILFE